MVSADVEGFIAVTLFSGAFEFFDDEQAFAAMGAPVAAPAPALASASAARAGRWKKQDTKPDPCRGFLPSEKMARFAHEVAEKIIAKPKAFLPQDPLSVPRTLDPDNVRKRDLKILRTRLTELQRDRKADRKEIDELYGLIRNLECVIFQRDREIAAYQQYVSRLTAMNRQVAQQVDSLKTQTSGLAEHVAVLETKVGELQVENAVLKAKIETGFNWEQAAPWFAGAIGSLIVSLFLPDEAKPIGYVVSGACGTIGLLKL